MYIDKYICKLFSMYACVYRTIKIYSNRLVRVHVVDSNSPKSFLTPPIITTTIYTTNLPYKLQ